MNGLSTPSGGNCVGSAPVRPSHVQEELGTLRVKVNILNETCGRLAQKLEFVRRQDGAVELNKKEVDRNVVGLANEIRIERYKIEELTEAISLLINQIEL